MKISFSNYCSVYNDVSTNSLNLTKPGLVISDICVNNVYVEESILDLSRCIYKSKCYSSKLIFN